MANEDNDSVQINKPKQENTLIKTLIINIISTALVCVIFVCANYVVQTNLLNSKLAVLNNPNSDSDSMDDDETEQVKRGIVVDLGDFILNLADVNQRRYLKANIALEITEPHEPVVEEEPKKSGGHGHGHSEPAEPKQSELEKMLMEYKPAIRDAVITTLSTKTAVELSTAAGKELSKEQIMAAVNGILGGKNEVIRVSFGQFIIQ